MKEDKDIKIQINEYHKLLEDLKTEKIVRRICCEATDKEIARILEQLQEPIEATTCGHPISSEDLFLS